MKPALMLLLAAAPQDDPSLVSGPRPTVSQEVLSDAEAVFVVAPPSANPLPEGVETSGPESAGGVTRRPLQRPQLEESHPALSSRMSIRNLMTEVLFDEPQDGRVWARGRDYRASFGEEGFTFFPVMGKRAPREFPLEFSLEQITVDGTPLALGARSVERQGSSVTIDHGAIEETYHLDLDQVEQTFVFDSLPATGELVVRMEVETELAASVDERGIHFTHPEFGHATYGDAFAFDATGERIPIERTWLDGDLELRVPAEFVAGAVLPLTIDPPVTFFSSGFGAADDGRPDITFDGRSNLYWVAWEEYTSFLNSECYVTNFTTGGTQGTSFAIDTTTEHWFQPKIAYHYGADRLLVVSNVLDANGNFSVKGRFIDAATNSVLGAPFAISSTGVLKVSADVGGNNWDSTSSSYFCVAWCTMWAADDHDVQYRIVDWDGTFITGLTSVDTTAANDIQVAISETHGDADLFGDWWTIAWTRDDNSDEMGQIWARRVVWSGDPNIGNGNFIVDTSNTCSFPSVTSRLDSDLLADSERPSIVAYQREFVTASGNPPTQNSIYARVVGDGVAYASNAVSFQLEDVDGELDQRHVSIATDGNAFFMVYSEIDWSNPVSGDYDMYMLSGHVSQTATNAYLALAERHQNLAFGGVDHDYGRVCTTWDGESDSTSDNACAIWVELSSSTTGYGLLEGATLEAPTLDTSTIIAVGRQYCDANPNSRNSSYSADVSSWAWMDGDQDLGTVHRVYCVDVPNNQFGYLLAGQTSADINKPGGSQGRLCISGAGRYISQIQNSGNTGTLATNVNPLNIPQPGGSVSAMPGETWRFQYWHRDVGGNSNFSSAVSVTFEP